METSTILIASAIGTILTLIILYYVIRWAISDGNKVEYRDKHLKIQTNILLEIARRQGVSEEEIKNIADPKKDTN